ncbi:MAG: beta-lactamase family protein [Flavobacteriales bacterium]|nr:beta-lactamase family protein [Flavobacteriales bacterium]
MRLSVLLIFISTLIWGCGESEAPIVEKKSSKKAEMIGSMLNLLHQQNKLNGCVLVSEGNEVIYEECFGYANFETKDTLTPDARFRLSNLSFQMTAMSVMILEEKGKLDLDDDLQMYLPELPYKGVTIRQCLQLTSGLPDYNWLMAELENSDSTLFYNIDVLNMLVEKAPPMVSEPGKKWEFNETGYVLIPIIVERVSGKSYGEFMEDEIFGPLEMNNTVLTTGNNDANILNRAHGYSEKEVPMDFHSSNGIVGDGGIYSTVADLFKWDQALYTEKLVKKDLLAEASRPYRLKNDMGKGNYGFGVNIYNDEGVVYLEHDGEWLGFSNYIVRDLTRKNLIAILTNKNQNPEILSVVINDILTNDEY